MMSIIIVGVSVSSFADYTSGLIFTWYFECSDTWTLPKMQNWFSAPHWRNSLWARATTIWRADVVTCHNKNTPEYWNYRLPEYR